MQKYQTEAIIIRRIEYGEADRIIAFITKDHGKVNALAKGVRRTRSKLAGGLELFSVSDITFLKGKGELDRVISTRLSKHYENIVSSYERISLGYELLKLVYKLFEHDLKGEGFHVLKRAFEQLDDTNVDLAVIELWFYLQLLGNFGHQPNVKRDVSGSDLNENRQYEFDIENAAFANKSGGQFSSDHIKTLKILRIKKPIEVVGVNGLGGASLDLLPTFKRFMDHWLH